MSSISPGLCATHPSHCRVSLLIFALSHGILTFSLIYFSLHWNWKPLILALQMAGSYILPGHSPKMSPSAKSLPFLLHLLLITLLSPREAFLLQILSQSAHIVCSTVYLFPSLEGAPLEDRFVGFCNPRTNTTRFVTCTK